MNNGKERVISVNLKDKEDSVGILPKQSANSLFRFFQKKEYLFESIKQKALFPRYYPENVEFLRLGYNQLAYPMICFCDINIHKLEDHLNVYGKYGIAFSKRWGIHQGIQPLQYINEESILRKDFTEAFSKSLTEDGSGAECDYLATHMMYVKPIEGSMPRNGKEIDRNFTDEKEWRFIPNVNLLDLPPIVPNENIASLDTLNNTLSDHDECWLRFCSDDIKYIILEKSEDFQELYETVQSSYDDELEKARMLTKVLIWDEVKEDF